jgi:excisionase family DNA binding protein
MKKSRNERRSERIERAIKLRRESGLVRGELLSIEEACEYSHLGLSTIYDCVKKTLIRSFKVPEGPQMFDSADLDDYLKKGEIPARS